MCGIVGYIGKSSALPILIDGLKKLEYRGYDSSGVAVVEKRGKLSLQKKVGKIAALEESIKPGQIKGSLGIAHTRWATHGKPSEENAHPHSDCQQKLAIVHNGIIENYQEIKKDLIREGHTFSSETDTEVLVHLVEKFYKNKDLEKAVLKALHIVKGSYAIAVISKNEPEKIVVARNGSPLIIGIKNGDRFLASDITALIKYTGKIIYVGNGELAVLKRGSHQFYDLSGKKINKKVSYISWDPVSAEKSGYAHFMLKEIHEQPKAVIDTFHGKISQNSSKINFLELGLSNKDIKSINRIIFTACGTSWHAGLVGEYLLEQFVKIPVEVEYAAEFRYRDPIVDKNTLVIAISQSGETADTLGAVAEAKEKGAKVLSICNVYGSSIPRESNGTIYTKAGPEIGVASTKAFTTQIEVIYLLGLYFAQVRKTMKSKEIKNFINDLLKLPDKIKEVLKMDKEIEELADRFYKRNHALYLGRGEGFPVALEGALKLKEISYIHAIGYPAAEMKHGPIALIDHEMPVVVLALRGRRYDKILGNVEEVKARGGIVIAIATEGDKEIKQKADETVYIPKVSEELSPILAVLPLQLLAYYIAVKRGCSVDQPRNLAKSVTVE